MNGKFKVAVVGAGIGRLHAEAFRALPDLFAVGLVCDLDPERAREVAAAAPGAEVTSDYEGAVLGRADIDIVDLCTPPFLHYEMAGKALRAGKHVICEKPLAGSLAEVDELARLATAAGRHLIPVFQYRFGNGFRKLEGLVRQGITGRAFVTSIETHWNRTRAYYDGSWHGRRSMELGGAIISHAIHMHDLIAAIHGPFRRVFARTDVRVNPVETEDCAALSFEMADGALVTHSVTLGSADDMSRLRFCFEHLTAESGREPYRPGSGAWQFLARGDQADAPRLEEALTGFADMPEGYEGLFRASHEALTTGAPPPVTLEEARHSIEVATAIYWSAASGKEVTLPLGSDHPAYRGWSASSPKS